MEQIRIIKEMRENDRSKGRAAVDLRPRWMLWENVPGATSSGTPKGEDFRIVLEEAARVADPNAVIPQPPKGKWSNSGCIVGDGWSIAWAIRDSRFLRIPQRRRRIALVADFGGECAHEILFFKPQGLSRDTTPSHKERETAPTDSTGSIGVSSRPKEHRNASCDNGGETVEPPPAGVHISAGFCPEEGGKALGIGYKPEESPSLRTNAVPAVVTNCVGADCYNMALTGGAAMSIRSKSADAEHIPCVVCFEPGAASRLGGYCYDGISGTLRAEMGDNLPCVCVKGNPSASRKSDASTASPATSYGLQIQSSAGIGGCLEEQMGTLIIGDNPGWQNGVMQAIETSRLCYDARGNGDGNVSPTITGGHEATISDYTAIVLEPVVEAKNWDGGDISPTLTSHNANGAQRMPDKDNFNCVLQPILSPAYTLKIRGGVAVDSAGKAAGKGALVQTDLAGTIGASHDQYLFQAVDKNDNSK